MINVSIPGFGDLELRHVVFDYNGTLALDGKISEQVRHDIIEMNQNLNLHVVTADTYGRAKSELRDLPVQVHLLEPGKEAEQKLQYVRSLQSKSVVAVGNGNNDRQMLKEARLGIMLLGAEGGATAALRSADMIVENIGEVFGLLQNPLRLKATLRY
jgi:P-type E1-E2 ATPase